MSTQPVPKPRPKPQPLVLPATVRTLIDNALVDKRPMLMAHTAPDGQPVLSYRGSVQVLGDDRLGLWVRNAQGAFLQALALNPRVAFMVRQESSRATYQLQGRAYVSAAEADRTRVFEGAALAERNHDLERRGVAVIVELDRVEGYAGVGPAGQIDAICLQRGA